MKNQKQSISKTSKSKSTSTTTNTSSKQNTSKKTTNDKTKDKKMGAKMNRCLYPSKESISPKNKITSKAKPDKSDNKKEKIIFDFQKL